MYLKCTDEMWIVDELRNRVRPESDTRIQLSDVLRRSEATERGDGLRPVCEVDLLVCVFL